jgi:peptide/nickel transport system substrate-binding protein
MTRSPCKWIALVAMASLANAALAQKTGGTLRVPLRENPGSASLHEESSITANFPFMAVFNNLVLYDQQDRMARLESIKPDLATGWSWSADNKTLTFTLRQGVKWHDGKPFTSADVQCTWDTIKGKRNANWRKNSHQEWYHNLKEVTVSGPNEVSFVLERAQPSFLSFLASGWSAVYPCHVDGRVMRQKPIGTGPFKVVEFRPNDVIRLVKNTDYWKPGRPYLDAIEHRIMPSQATRTLSFVSGQFDMTGPGDVNSSVLKDIRGQAPKAVCETTASNVVGSLLVNHKAPPFDNPKIRRALSLALDRRAFVAAQQGDGRVGGVMMTPPYGNWGLSPEQLDAVPGHGKDVERNRAEARKLMEEAGYGPNKKLKTSFLVRMSTPNYMLGVSMVADQLRTIYIEGEIDQKEYTVFTGAILKGAYTLGFHTTGAAMDDPDVVLYENYTCASPRNYTKYCSREMEAKIEEQSATVDQKKRKQLVQQIDVALQQDNARPTLYQAVSTTCWHPYVKGYMRSSNGIYTHNRLEDVWLDR